MILFFLIILFIPVHGNAMKLEDSAFPERDYPAITQNDRAGEAICSFIASLFSQAAETAGATYQLPSDSKYYLKLFSHSKHDKIRTLALDCTTVRTSPQIFPELERTAYYIYALHKIIV